MVEDKDATQYSTRVKTLGSLVTKQAEESDEVFQVDRVDTITFFVLAFIWEALIVIIYAIWLGYSDDPDVVARFYAYSSDVLVMLLFGFGFLMTYMRRYGFSAISYVLFLSAFIIQWSIILENFYESIGTSHTIGGVNSQHIGSFNFLNAYFCAAATMIAFGGLLGKTTITELLIISFIQPMFFWINVYIQVYQLQAHDVGGGCAIHVFGCYFGLTVTKFLTTRQTLNCSDNTSCYSSDIFSLAGTIFLWIYWPSFNAAPADPGYRQTLATVNTLLSLTGSTIAVFTISRLVSHGQKFEAVHIQNSTLAGGVVMGVAADLNVSPAGAIGSGLIAGAVSCLGFRFITPILNNKLKLQDVAGINNLHGMPGILSGLVGIFTTIRYTDQFAFPRGTSQPAYQLAFLGTSLGFAIVGGLITSAVILLVRYCSRKHVTKFYNDRIEWQIPSDYDYVVRPVDKRRERYVNQPLPSERNLAV